MADSARIKCQSGPEYIQSRKECPIKPGEWIVRPYSNYRIEIILKAIKKGRLKSIGDTIA